MLAGRDAVFFVGQHLQGADQPEAGAGGFDDVVDVAAFGSGVGIGELFGILRLAFEQGLLGIGGVLRLFAEDHLHRALGAHHGDLGARPGIDQVSPHVAAVHDAIGSAIGFAQDDGDLGHGGFGEGIEELGAVANDAVVFLVGARQEAGDVLQHDERDVESVAKADKTRALDRSVDIQHSRQNLGLVGHDAHGEAVQPGKAGDDVLGKVHHHLQELAFISNGVDDVQHIIGLVRVFGDDVVQDVAGAVNRVVGGFIGRVFHVVGRQVAKQLFDEQDGLFLAVGDEVCHAALAGVHARAAQIFRGDGLVKHRFHHLWAGHEHIAVALFHDHKVRDRGGIDSAAGAGAKDGGDLGHHAACHHVTPEDFGITSQGVNPFLDAGSAAVVQTDHRTAVFERHVHDLTNLFRVGFGKRTTKDGEILGEDIDQALVDGGAARYHAIAGDELLVHAKVGASVGDKEVKLLEAAGVNQQLDPFPGCELAFFVLFLDAFFASAQNRLIALLTKADDRFACCHLHILPVFI